MLTGTIKSASGEKMEGVTVSARGRRKDIHDECVYRRPMVNTTSRRWNRGITKCGRRARGFDAGRADVNLAASIKRQDFVLKTTTQDFTAQLPGDMWSGALSEDTPEDREMKTVFRMACVGPATDQLFRLAKIDSMRRVGRKIIDVMSRVGHFMGPGSDIPAKPNPMHQYYKKTIGSLPGEE